MKIMKILRVKTVKVNKEVNRVVKTRYITLTKLARIKQAECKPVSKAQIFIISSKNAATAIDDGCFYLSDYDLGKAIGRDGFCFILVDSLGEIILKDIENEKLCYSLGFIKGLIPVKAYQNANDENVIAFEDTLEGKPFRQWLATLKPVEVKMTVFGYGVQVSPHIAKKGKDLPLAIATKVMATLDRVQSKLTWLYNDFLPSVEDGLEALRELKYGNRYKRESQTTLHNIAKVKAMLERFKQSRNQERAKKAQASDPRFQEKIKASQKSKPKKLKFDKR